MKSKLTILFSMICVLLCFDFGNWYVVAEEGELVENISLSTESVVSINRVFGDYQSAVDENIYYSMSSVDDNSLDSIFGNCNSPMFNKAKECINPCMAFATTWGEAGSSYKGISLTTVMDFNPNTYVDSVDWLSLSRNLEQVDCTWYITNSKRSYNTNENGNAFHMPNALLQVPKGGDRSTSEMTGLGVGPYQITSSDWDKWTLDNRVNPIWGFEDSLRKCGTSWINCGIVPISDLTVYAALSLSHQGGTLIDYDFGLKLINDINTYPVQDAINRAGRDMFLELLERAYTREVSLADIDVGVYVNQVQNETGLNFSSYNGGVGTTNKGNYVIKHCIRYVFYKYYFTSGDYNKQSYDKNQIWEQSGDTNFGLSYQSDYALGTHEHVAYKQSEFIHDISGDVSIAGAGCGWCSLTSAMAELNPAMCGGITPVDWLSTPMNSVGSSYWGQGGMSWSGPDAWIDAINEIEIYGRYSVIAKGEGVTSSDVVEAISTYAGESDNVVIVSASSGLFTNGGHIMCVTDLNGDYFHLADSSTLASNVLGVDWSEMNMYNFPYKEEGKFVTGVGGYSYNFKCYWVIHREE